ncbi:MAG: radical SAM protein [Halioglobus sp.]|nr:radical SAM protein [Halioglobus sp.]
MGSEPVSSSIYPNPRLLVVIEPDGKTRLARNRKTPPWDLSLAELEMLSALGARRIANVREGLDAYLDTTALNEIERARCRKLAMLLLHQKRFDRAEGVYKPVVSAGELPASPAALIEGPLTLLTPCTFRLREDRFEAMTRDGTALEPLTAPELHALSQLVQHPLASDALNAHRDEAGAGAVDRVRFTQLLSHFAAHRLIVARSERSDLSGAELTGTILAGKSSEILREMFRRNAQQQDDAEREREAATGVRRPKVIPVAFDVCPPAGLGAIVAYAKVHDDGALERFYNFRTDWVWDPDRLASFTAEPAIYLFTNYLWSHAQCIEVSARIKALSPDSITIHGGPDTPKYEGDQRRYFEQYPHVDVTIQGEGEISCAEALSRLRSVIGNPNPDLGVLEGVAGVTYRSPGGIVRNPNQGRIKDLNVLPSAYLTGLFDNYIGVNDLFVILETNRGCPYGCTFCDWGSATASKIRQFDIERVNAELEWTARAQAASVSIADANFGIFPRDVDIARKAAALKNATGYPRGFGGNYAKNTVAHLRQIIDVLAEGKILTLGSLSLQSMDEVTLNTINRSNIKTEKYDALAVEMRRSALPLTIELMMGLPGSTLASFREDLQQCIDRELPARVNMTTLLVNSPMNEPSYVEAHQIKTSVPLAPGNLATLASTASYTEADLSQMQALRSAYIFFENFGVLRTTARFVRHETALDEMSFYEQLLADTEGHRAWPMLNVLCNFGSSLMAPPVSWFLVIEELGRYLRQQLGLADGPALRSLLAAQLASLPAHDRAYPERVDLECDVGAWFTAMIEEKESGNRRGWTESVPRLASFGPGSLTVGDPCGITRAALGINRELNSFGLNWELDSPLHRARADLS